MMNHIHAKSIPSKSIAKRGKKNSLGYEEAIYRSGKRTGKRWRCYIIQEDLDESEGMKTICKFV